MLVHALGDIAFIEKWRPDRGQVSSDSRNGRFLIGYPNKNRVSISWTKRGAEAASVMAFLGMAL